MEGGLNMKSKKKIYVVLLVVLAFMDMHIVSCVNENAVKVGNRKNAIEHEFKDLEKLEDM
jgi:hypothetical protein